MPLPRFKWLCLPLANMIIEQGWYRMYSIARCYVARSRNGLTSDLLPQAARQPGIGGWLLSAQASCINIYRQMLLHFCKYLILAILKETMST